MCGGRRVRQICRILSSFFARCLPLSNMSRSLAVCKSICVPCKLIGILTFCLIRLPGHVARHEGRCFIWNSCKTRQVVWKVERKGVVARCRFEALRPHRQAIAQNSLTFFFGWATAFSRRVEMFWYTWYHTLGTHFSYHREKPDL